MVWTSFGYSSPERSLATVMGFEQLGHPIGSLSSIVSTLSVLLTPLGSIGRQNMRVTLATEFLPESSAAEITGGVEAYTHFVGGRLGDHHEVEIVARRTSGDSIDTATMDSLLGRVLFMLRSMFQVWRSRPEVTIGTNYVSHPAAWIGGRLRRARVVFWYPDVLIGSWRSGAFGKFGVVFEYLERAVLSLPADCYVAITETVRDKLIAQGIAPHKIIVIPCGYDPDEVARISRTSTGEPPQVVVVGRLVPYKRVDLVIEAVALLAAENWDLHLEIIGQGAELEELKGLATTRGVEDRVTFRGHVRTHAAVLEAIAASEILVSASEIEGFGIVLAEAMALGTAVVASDIAVFREVSQQGKGALHFAQGNAQELADQIRSLLADPQLREQQVLNAREVCREYRWDKIADTTSTLIENLGARREVSIDRR